MRAEGRSVCAEERGVASRKLGWVAIGNRHEQQPVADEDPERDVCRSEYRWAGVLSHVDLRKYNSCHRQDRHANERTNVHGRLRKQAESHDETCDWRCE